MFGIDDALIGAGASLLGGFLSNATSSASVDKQLAFQQQSNERAMAQSAAEAEKNRSWQERMSGTAHQREVSDLRLAGLNPILSVNRSGAATGGGATGQGVSSAGASFHAVNPAEGVASSALSASQMANVAAEIDVKKAQAENIRAQTLTELERPTNVSEDTKLKYALGRTEGQRPAHVMAMTDEANAQARLNIVNKVLAEMYGPEKVQAESAANRASAALHGASAKSAATKAELDAALSQYERLIGMGEGATSALRNLNPLSGIFKKK